MQPCPSRRASLGWQGQDQHARRHRDEPARDPAQRVMFPVGGIRIIVDANDQVDGLRRRVVDGYRERPHARPIGVRLRRPISPAPANRPALEFDLHGRCHPALTRAPADLGEACALLAGGARHRPGCRKRDDRRQLPFSPPALRRHPQRSDNKVATAVDGVIGAAQPPPFVHSQPRLRAEVTRTFAVEFGFRRQAAMKRSILR